MQQTVSGSINLPNLSEEGYLYEDDQNLNTVGNNNTSLIPKEPKSLSNRCYSFFCNRTSLKISTFILSGIIFPLTSYFIVEESLGSHNIEDLTLNAFFNGAAFSALFYTLLPGKYRKEINEFITAWTYEVILGLSQVYLNVVPENQMKLFGVPFDWGFGALKIKDIFSLLAMEQPDLTLAPTPPNKKKIIPTLGFNTRDSSLPAMLWLTANVVTAMGLTALNFSIVDKYDKDLGDFATIGLYQDLIALYSGNVAGTILARIIDDRKEKIELIRAKQLIPTKAPLIIKTMRLSKKFFVLFVPVMIGTTLAIETPPNSLSDYFVKLFVGGLYGANLFINRREFENPASDFHQIALVKKETTLVKKETTLKTIEESENPASDLKAIEEPENPSLDTHQLALTKKETTLAKVIEKVKVVSKKYLPSAMFFAALTGYMSWAAATNIPRVDYAIVVLLTTTFASFGLTDIIANNREPKKNRLYNELIFRLIYSSIAMAIFFQFLTTKVDIGDQELDNDANSLYTLSIISWIFWGLNVGNNRAINIQEPRIQTLPITPPIAMQELSKNFYQSFKKP